MLNWGQEDFFLLIQTLPTCWAERIRVLRICICFFGPQISGFPGAQISKFQDFQISRSPDFQMPPMPAAPATDEFSDPNLTPSQRTQGPNTQYVARSPCCDHTSIPGVFEAKAPESWPCSQRAVWYCTWCTCAARRFITGHI